MMEGVVCWTDCTASLCLHAVCTSPILMNTISQERLEGISSNLAKKAKRPLGLKDELKPTE